MSRAIFLIGYMASGKTTLGRALARRLGYRFIDLDFYITQRFRRSVAEIFAERGEEGFRRLESNMLQEVGGMDDVVISCGGGTPCFFDNMDFILANGFCVWLDTDVDCMVRRLLVARVRRPLVEKAGNDPERLRKLVSAHLEERTPFYSRADIKFAGDLLEDRRQIDDSVDRLIGLLPS